MSNFLKKKNNLPLHFFINLVALAALFQSCTEENLIGQELVNSTNFASVLDTTNYTIQDAEYAETDSVFVIVPNDIINRRSTLAYVGNVRDEKFGNLYATHSFMMQYSPNKNPPREDSVIIRGAYLLLTRGTNNNDYPSFPFEQPTDLNLYTLDAAPRQAEEAKKSKIPVRKKVASLQNILPNSEFASSQSGIKLTIDTNQFTTQELKETFFDRGIYDLSKTTPRPAGIVDTIDSRFLRKNLIGFKLQSPKGSLIGFHPFFTSLVVQYSRIDKTDKVETISFPSRSYTDNVDKIRKGSLAFENRIAKRALSSGFKLERGEYYTRGFDFSKLNMKIVPNKDVAQKKPTISFMQVIVPLNLEDRFVQPLANLTLYSGSSALASGAIADSSKVVFNLTQSLLGTDLDLDNLSIQALTFSPNRAILKLDQAKIEVLYTTQNSK